MRGLLYISLLAASLAHSAANEYQEVRELNLPAGDLSKLDVDAGAGKLEVIGDSSVADIQVVATIVIDDVSEAQAERLIDDIELTLDRDGNEARLVSDVASGWLDWGSKPRINLVVTVPAHLDLDVDDGSGSMRIVGVGGNTRIEDGSGSIDVRDLGADARIDDGSGSIDVHGVMGDLLIDDGSGSIDIVNVAGSVTIDDGSGGIDVEDVGGDLVILDAGSGGVRFSGIQGAVDYDDS